MESIHIEDREGLGYFDILPIELRVIIFEMARSIELSQTCKYFNRLSGYNPLALVREDLITPTLAGLDILEIIFYSNSNSIKTILFSDKEFVHPISIRRLKEERDCCGCCEYICEYKKAFPYKISEINKFGNTIKIRDKIYYSEGGNVEVSEHIMYRMDEPYDTDGEEYYKIEIYKGDLLFSLFFDRELTYISYRDVTFSVNRCREGCCGSTTHIIIGETEYYEKYAVNLEPYIIDLEVESPTINVLKEYLKNGTHKVFAISENIFRGHFVTKKREYGYKRNEYGYWSHKFKNEV